jgi:hypothetical protein
VRICVLHVRDVIGSGRAPSPLTTNAGIGGLVVLRVWAKGSETVLGWHSVLNYLRQPYIRGLFRQNRGLSR